MNDSNLVVQCELRHIENLGDPTNRQMVTWLEADRGVKRGGRVTLKDLPSIWWEVISVGQPHKRSDIKRGWGMTDYFGKETDRK